MDDLNASRRHLHDYVCCAISYQDGKAPQTGGWLTYRLMYFPFGHIIQCQEMTNRANPS